LREQINFEEGFLSLVKSLREKSINKKSLN